MLDGKTYAFTNRRPADKILSFGMWIRQDWLDKLGLKAPTTIDEFVEVAKAFKTLGDDIVPLAYPYQFINTIYNAHAQWYEKDDGSGLEYGVVTKRYADSIAMLKKMYEEGIVDKEYFVDKGGSKQYELWNSGKAGIMFSSWDSSVNQTLLKNDPNANPVQLEAFSTDIGNRLVPDFLDYGVQLKRFYVTTIVKPDGDPQYEKFKELHFRQYADIAEAQLQQRVGIIEQQTEAQKMVIESQAIAQKRMQEGYTYQQERGYDVAEKAAQNEGIGEFSNMGIGLGMMTGVGGAVGGMVGGAVSDAFAGMGTAPQQPVTANKFCDQCGAELTPGAAFCDECGAPQAPSDTCSKCGFKFTKPGKFCPKCGTKREG